jgi:hypothetical protein
MDVRPAAAFEDVEGFWQGKRVEHASITEFCIVPFGYMSCPVLTCTALTVCAIPSPSVQPSRV